MKFKREVTHVIFFDIEYYVPKEYRNRPGLKANPYLDGSFVIGGVFQRYFPIEDKLEEKEEFWIWDMEGRDTMEQEKNLLEKIYLYFRESWTRWELLGGGPRLTEPMVAGFGITRLDVPVLFIKSLVHRIAEPERLYDTYFKLRHFDLSVASAPLIPENKDRKVLSPVSQNWAVKNLFGDGERKPSGTTVWELYDEEEYQSIMERTRGEVELARRVYQELRKIRNGLPGRP
ncbi:hypothetical protein [Thermococcus sp. 9N3]|uniref:hypothetical protein n=1 Tax=Thermococcus sp. 9N3 TaxID=163002 RepID=UPI001430F514|nr:hypothetical protein [Thermococcus sp. 9N3]NJE49611.1 hypothetical protein [Thermococcus sp. 9N3]